MTETSAPPSTQLLTFLIADVRGYTRFTVEHGDEAGAQLAAQFAAIVGETVQAREGQLLELRGDEALVVFGSARQALRAALELQARLAEPGDDGVVMRAGIGLDAGEAIPVAGGYRGGALNLAARLCSLAGPGEVLASDTVTNLARKMDGLTYTDRGLVDLKGFVDKVKVLQIMSDAMVAPTDVEGPSPTDALPEQDLPIGGFLGSLPGSSMVGREEELRHAIEAIDAVAAGGGRTIALAGEPGVGKTRLAQEITLQLRNRGFLFAAGSCYEAQQATPFYPFLTALRQLYTVCPAEVRREVPRQWPYLGTLLPGQDIPVPAVVGDGRQEQERLFWAVTGFLQAIAERYPVAVLLDDLHWSDGSSLQLVQHLARHTRGSRVLLLGTYRDIEIGRQHPLEATLRELTREGLVDRISLRRLQEEDTGALMAAAMGAERISQEFTELVHKSTDGNPFFVQQVLRVLVERGDIYREGGRWERKTIGEIEVPESVRSVIGQRLGRLSDDTQEVLHEASVLGQTFLFEELLSLGERSERGLEAALDEARGAGLVRETGRDGYAFDHALTQQALYGEISSRRRRRLHLAAGEAIEALPERKRERRASELARHFVEADEPERALRWSLLAGDQAEAIFAHSDAEWHYRTALELARDLDDQATAATAAERLGRVLGILSRYDEAVEALEVAAETYRALANFDSQARVMAFVGHLDMLRGAGGHGVIRLEAVLAESAENDRSPGLARLLATLSRLYWSTRDFERAKDAAERSSALARELGDMETLGEAELRRGTALMHIVGVAEAEPVLVEALRIQEAVGNLLVMIPNLHNLSVTRQMLGDIRGHVHYRERALEVADQLGDPGQIAFATDGISTAHSMLGNLERAGELAERGVAIARPLGDTWATSYPYAALGRVRVLQRRYEEAHALFTEAERIAEAAADLQSLPLIAAGAAELDLAQGKPEVARARLEAIDARLDSQDPMRAYYMVSFARAYLATGEPMQARDLLEQVIVQRGKWGEVFVPQALSVQALLLAGEGQVSEADALFAEALASARAMSYMLAEIEILYDTGRALQARGRDAEGRRHLEEALSIAERMGSQHWIERVQESLSG